jgi:hypothetical protein
MTVEEKTKGKKEGRKKMNVRKRVVWRRIAS